MEVILFASWAILVGTFILQSIEIRSLTREIRNKDIELDYLWKAHREALDKLNKSNLITTFGTTPIYSGSIYTGTQYGE